MQYRRQGIARCLICGAPLEEQKINYETVYYCSRCQEVRMPPHQTVVNLIVLNRERSQVLLMKPYGQEDYVLIAGTVHHWENLESEIARELWENTGYEAEQMYIFQKKYHANRDMLVINCMVAVEKETPTGKMHGTYHWFPVSEAEKKLKEGSSAQKYWKKYKEM